MGFVDGFVIAVPAANKAAFIEHAKMIDAMFLDYGAIRVVENWGEDVPDGKLTDFRRAVQAKQDEVVVFSWVEWPDRATRDAGMGRFEAAMKTDDRFDPAKNPVPFDGKRMIIGGFATIVMEER